MISVVIPLYNKKDIILRCLSSVLTQTYTAFEVVIVNDGSTDESVELIQNFTTDKRVRIINQENQGVSAARNKGIANSTFEYVALLDADDEWRPYFLEYIAHAIARYPHAGMLGTASWHNNYQTGEGDSSTIPRYYGKTVEVDYFENPHTMPHTSATVFKKSTFNQLDEAGEGFPVGMRLHEDWTCCYRMALLAPVVYIGYPLGIRNNNVKGQITGSADFDRFKLIPDIAKFYKMVYTAWKATKPKNKNYLLFMKYEIRGKFCIALKKKDFNTVNAYLEQFPEEVLNHLSKMERWIYKKPSLRYLAIVYILYTKWLWRRHGFPVFKH